MIRNWYKAWIIHNSPTRHPNDLRAFAVNADVWENSLFNYKSLETSTCLIECQLGSSYATLCMKVKRHLMLWYKNEI